MDKKTLIRLATPASIFALAISIATLPLTTKAYGTDKVKVEGVVSVMSWGDLDVEVVDMPSRY